MNAVIEFLDSIPDVVWSGLLASVITLAGVFLTNRSHTKRLRLQLQHDATEKQRERIAQLQREVYLRAAEEMPRAMNYLTTLGGRDFAAANDDLKEFFAASSKLQLVAAPDTALLANRLTEQFGMLLLNVFERAMPLQEAKSDIALSDSMLKTSQGHVTRLLGEMERFNTVGDGHPRTFHTIQQNLEFHQAQAEKFAQDNFDAWDRYNKHNVDLMRYVIPEMQRLGEIHIPLAIALRKDLGLTAELATWEAQLRRQWVGMEGELSGFLDRMEEKIRSGSVVP